MISWINEKFVLRGNDGNIVYREGICLSTDTKPDSADDGCANGSRLYEMDSGDTYFYTEPTGEWIKTGDTPGDAKVGAVRVGTAIVAAGS